MSDLFKTLKAAVALDRKHIIAAILAEPDLDADAALVWAVTHKATRMAELLLEHGANANALTSEGEPVLVYVATENRLRMAKVLLDHSADVNARGKDGETALMRATRLRMVRLLLRNCAAPNVQNDAGRTALMKAAYYNSHYVMQTLFDNGALLNMRDSKGQTALMLATMRGQGNAYIALLDRRVTKVDVQDNDGNTALMLVIQHGSGRFSWAPAESLILYRADVNIQNNAGETALMLAMHNGNEGLIRALLKAGAKTELKDSKGRTARDVAVKLGKNAFVNLLDQHLQAA